MDLEILKTEKMAQTGETLPSLMGDVLLPLDLLVRESVQNSLDAAKKKERNERVGVDFIVGDFDSDRFCGFLDCELSDTILKEFGNGRQRFLSIRDSGTVGLTGRMEDDSSNLSKLVYQVFQKQQAKGAGGSCGVGKTTYFRIGKGIVFYYSAFPTRSGHETRLAGIVTDDPKKKRIIRSKNSRGIAFFGQYRSKDAAGTDNDSTEPVSDPLIAKDFLDIFGLKPYDLTESGTTIIIPYIDEKDLLDRCRPRSIDGTVQPQWASSIANYIAMASQRWYFARVNNQLYDGPWLKLSINGKPLSKDAMHPFFRLLQDMYNHSKRASNTEGPIIHSESIRKKVVEGSVVGDLIWTCINPLEYGLYRNRYRDVHSLVEGFDADKNDGIMMFMRRPAMCVRYVCGDSQWMPQNAVSEGDMIIVSLFKLNSDARLPEETVTGMRSRGRTGIATLEDYVRACEREDHYDWTDLSGMDIVQKIKTSVRTKLAESFDKREDTSKDGVQHSVSAKLTRAFMPSPDIHAENGSTGRRGFRGGSRNKASFEITDSVFDDGVIRIGFSLRTYTGENTTIKLVVHGETSTYDENDWKSSIGTDFPYSIRGVTITRITCRKRLLIETDEKLGRSLVRLTDSISGIARDHDVTIFDGNGATIEGIFDIVCSPNNMPIGLKMEESE